MQRQWIEMKSAYSTGQGHAIFIADGHMVQSLVDTTYGLNSLVKNVF